MVVNRPTVIIYTRLPDEDLLREICAGIEEEGVLYEVHSREGCLLYTSTMKRSKRIEALDQRAVNKDGFIDEWPEMGFVAMHSPYDPKPSIKIENGIITELDGKKREDFDFLDQFIADYAIRIDRAESSMAVSSLEIARKIVDIHVSRKEILEIVSGITPAKMAEVINCLNVVEMMMGMQKMRARRIPGNQAHITNLKDDPVQIAADAAEGALRGFSEEETTMGVARYAPFSAMALLIGSQVGRPGVLTQCSAEEATELELGIRGLTTCLLYTSRCV